jgi:phospholipid/cholesterol/gamma-HCH transport system permease protein
MSENHDAAQLQVQEQDDRTLLLTFRGRLDVHTTGPIWRQAVAAVERFAPRQLIADAGGIGYCDAAGVGLLLDLKRRLHHTGGVMEVRRLPEEIGTFLDLFDPVDFVRTAPPPSHLVPIPEGAGRLAYQLWRDCHELISFVGEFSMAFFLAFRHPSRIRWRDVLLITEKAGVNALGIVILISFLVGLIMAFQSAIAMRQFGAEIYVANMVAISMLRELGPLMTAIVLAGRSGSSFAAELGTMKINEEIDALTTFGLDPVRFLVVPRVLAALLVTPLLALFAGVIGVAGGSLVMLSLGFPLATYINQALSAVVFADLAGGLLKSLVFGIIVAAVGCLRGLQTGAGASAVGDAATRAVVSGIVLIVLLDGLFSVIYYYLGI